jgi:hypothetical protein
MTSNWFSAEGIIRLSNVMSKRLPVRDVTLCDTAVASLGKIYEFHHDNVGPKVIIFQNRLSTIDIGQLC